MSLRYLAPEYRTSTANPFKLGVIVNISDYRYYDRPAYCGLYDSILIRSPTRCGLLHEPDVAIC